jgi:hypothetical protein
MRINKRRKKRNFFCYNFFPKNHRGIDLPFGWLFAIIAGVVILFLAIFFSARFINFQQTTVGVETTKQIQILLDPLETGFESAQTTSFSIPIESRIYNQCDDFGTFGTQTIGLAQLTFNQWKNTSVDVSFENKYIFSDTQVEGKDFFVFSKAFNFPFKVSDLIYLTSSLEQYCFLNPPSNIGEELNNLNQSNILVRNNNCPSNSIKICFNQDSSCGINVNYVENYTNKNGSNLYFYSDALMYASIFSDKDVYECQVKRLMERTVELSSLYKDKEVVLPQDCKSNLGNDLTQLGDSAKNLAQSENIIDVGSFADELNQKNENSLCLLW